MAIRVLAADPDAYLWLTYAPSLEAHGVCVTHVLNALECIQQLRENEWDLLVLDPSVPWGGGDGVLALMNEDPSLPNIPVIVLTAVTNQRVLYRMASFRIADFRTKPLTSKRLLEGVLATHQRYKAELVHEKSGSSKQPDASN